MENHRGIDILHTWVVNDRTDQSETRIAKSVQLWLRKRSDSLSIVLSLKIVQHSCSWLARTLSPLGKKKKLDSMHLACNFILTPCKITCFSFAFGYLERGCTGSMIWFFIIMWNLRYMVTNLISDLNVPILEFLFSSSFG